MFANKLTINQNQFSGDTINIQLNIKNNFGIIDQDDLIDSVFVPKEVNNHINEIVDYEKVRIHPVNLDLTFIDNITYNIFLLINNVMTQVTYGDIGFSDSDLSMKKNVFTNSNLTLTFYDSDNALNQNELFNIVLYPKLTLNDLYVTLPSVGFVKPANQIQVKFTLSNPSTRPRGEHDGYFLYYFKDDITDVVNSLYMKAVFNNLKTGKSIILSTVSTPQIISELNDKLYTKYDLIKTSFKYTYKIDDNYSNNVNYSGNDLNLLLFQAQTL
jgi:hypothetical protein